MIEFDNENDSKKINQWEKFVSDERSFKKNKSVEISVDFKLNFNIEK